MGVDTVLTLLRADGAVPAAELEAAAREIEREGDPTPFRLAAHLVERGLLTETGAQDLLRRAAGASRAASPAQLEGRVVGNYRVIRRVSEGGMGAVYLAEHVTLGKRAALKVLLDERADDVEVNARFENEARLLARIQSPYVVGVFDFGREESRAYLLMEYVEGTTLATVLAESGPAPAREAARWAREACLGLQAIHEAGLVHRDLKPQNLLVSADGRVKICDFGVSVDLEQALHLTSAGLAVGTPLYIAPEQARGRKVDARSDIYALGATLYHLLAGEPPFTAESAMGVLLKHVREKPALAPLTRALVPSLLADIVLRMLAKDPRARYGSAAEAARVLEAFLQGVEAPRNTSGRFERRRAPVRRAPVGLIAGIVAVAGAILTGALVSISGKPRTPPPRPVGASPVASPAAPSREDEVARLVGRALEEESAGSLGEARAHLEAALLGTEDAATALRIRKMLEGLLARETRERKEAEGQKKLEAALPSLSRLQAIEACRAFLRDFPRARGRSAVEARLDALEDEEDLATVPSATSRSTASSGPRRDGVPAAGVRVGEPPHPPPLEIPERDPAVERDIRAVSELVSRLGAVSPFAPATPHAAAMEELSKLGRTLRTEAGEARAGWELLRREALIELAAGFADLLRRRTGEGVTILTNGNRLDGFLRDVGAEQVTLESGGGTVSLPFASFTRDDVLSMREGLSSARGAVLSPEVRERESAERALVREGRAPDPRCPLAAAVLLADKGDFRAALARGRALSPRLLDRRRALELGIARLFLEEARAQVGAGDLAAAQARLEKEPETVAALDRVLDGKLAALRSALPERALAWMERFDGAGQRVFARREADLFEKLGAAPALIERAAPLLFRLRSAGEWFSVPALGRPDERALCSWPRELADGDPKHALWRRVALPGDALALCSGVEVSVERGSARQAGILYDYTDDYAVMLFLDAEGDLTVQEWRRNEPTDAQTVKVGRRDAVKIRVEVNGDSLDVWADDRRAASWKWKGEPIRGLGLYVNDGKARFERLALRRRG